MKLTAGTLLLSLVVAVCSVHRGRMVCSLEGKMEPKVVSYLRETNIPLSCILQCFLRSSCISVLFDAKKYICSDASKTSGTTVLHFDTTLSTLQCKVIMESGTRCTTDSECSEQMKNSTCIQGNCLCDPMLRFSPSKAMCVENFIMENGASCTTDSECSEQMKNSTCIQGNCPCDPMLRFSPSKAMCVQKCETDGNTFSYYPGLGITMNNDASYSVNNRNECERQCLHADTFTCRSADYEIDNFMGFSHTCHLAIVTFGTVSFEYRSEKDEAWTLLQRNCG